MNVAAQENWAITWILSQNEPFKNGIRQTYDGYTCFYITMECSGNKILIF